ncbi:MAG: hypothetical protein B7Z80_27260 [Rhodospirillales bacterium 20-64-7]|nr:MAG: hypothetical protein B7Z80_27260 [Rhodospirillales bacterium 20-64-7]
MEPDIEPELESGTEPAGPMVGPGAVDCVVVVSCVVVEVVCGGGLEQPASNAMPPIIPAASATRIVLCCFIMPLPD